MTALLAPLLAPRALAEAAASKPVFHSSLKAASEAAAADQSLVMIDFTADWCAPCKELKARTLDSKEFMEQAGALHVVEIDVDAESAMAQDYGIQAMPTLVLLTADNKIVARREGFMPAVDLLHWLAEARDLAKAGKWEGTAPGPKLGEFITRAAADQLDTSDFARLIEFLSDQNPANRDTAAKILVEQREQAMVPLIEAVTNSYLGTRIAASEALHKLAADAASIDPWQSPAEIAQAAAALKKWWDSTGKLPALHAQSALDQAGSDSIKAALVSLRGSDPVLSTEALSTLVGCGPGALPAVRDAIKLAEKNGDQRSPGLLEDVRWAILIPDALDERAGGVRNILARGKEAERQAAATRLGQAGPPAIPALAELADDADSLVVESAVRALSSIGGKDAIPAMSALLKASDSNLRMTAAQALGHEKNALAVKDLLTVLNDPNEVVVCAALSALVEINGEDEYSPTKKVQPSEVIQALKACLGEPRWRVRAAAAETAGKLNAKELVGALNALLTDADGFVVKSSPGGVAEIRRAA